MIPILEKTSSYGVKFDNNLIVAGIKCSPRDEQIQMTVIAPIFIGDSYQTHVLTVQLEKSDARKLAMVLNNYAKERLCPVNNTEEPA